jgi:hypothetical protein
MLGSYTSLQEVKTKRRYCCMNAEWTYFKFDLYCNFLSFDPQRLSSTFCS